MIEIDDLRVRKNGRAICALSALRVAAGERVAVVGPNGSGKTTLLRVLAGLEARYDGRCAVEPSWRQRAWVEQSPLLFRGTVLANVAYGLRARGVHRAERERRATESLERLGVGRLAGSGTAHLSGGETRRVALARALVLQPRLLLLDEPLADLDEAGSDAFAEALDAMPECTVVVASPAPPPDWFTTRSIQLQASAGAVG